MDDLGNLSPPPPPQDPAEASDALRRGESEQQSVDHVKAAALKDVLDCLTPSLHKTIDHITAQLLEREQHSSIIQKTRIR